MKKIINYLLMTMLMTIGFFSAKFAFVEAEEAAIEIEDVVVNPKSDGSPMYLYEILIRDDSGNVTDTKKIQFTKTRDVSVLINYTDEELKDYDDNFKVCEIIKTNNSTLEKCSTYSKVEKRVYFQISSVGDGEKQISIRYFKSQVKRLEENKKIVLDTTGPVITLTGGEYLYIPLNERYEERYATCTDDSLYTEGSCVVEVEKASIDMSKDTYQYVRYKAVDFLGNETNAVRKVLVEIEVEDSSNILYWAGAGLVVFVVASLLLIQVWKNKEKQKNQSVL